jgi:hypothetical protein
MLRVLFLRGAELYEQKIILQTDLRVREDTISELLGEWRQDKVARPYRPWMAFYHASRLDLFRFELVLGRRDKAP